MNYSAVLLIVLITYLILQGFSHYIEYLNIRHMRAHLTAIPPDFKDVADLALAQKIFEYTKEKTYFGIVSSTFSSAFVLIFIFGGVLRWYTAWIGHFGFSFLLSGWLFFLLLYLIEELLSVPFALYFVFRIERKYGFTTTTPGLWMIDFLKGMVLGGVLLTMAVLGGLSIISWSPGFWWFWFWCLMVVFTLFLTYISPYVIQPLFNTFTPVEDASLKERIIDLASRAGIRVSRVLKMDASKRSRHTNAYFTGMGRTKRIVLFDTLIASMTHDEIIAVLAHEIGHWKRRHILKGTIVMEVMAMVLLVAAYYLIHSDSLAVLFGLSGDALFAKIVVAGFFLSMLSLFLRPAANAFTRKLEREADRFSCDIQGEPETMVRVLVKLTKDNLIGFYPHPLYALFNYSHPPVLERIEFVRQYCRKEKKEKR